MWHRDMKVFSLPWFEIGGYDFGGDEKRGFVGGWIVT
jgi:hypothetical protein